LHKRKRCHHLLLHVAGDLSGLHQREPADSDSQFLHASLRARVTTRSRRLHDAGARLTVFNRTPQRATPLAARGAVTAATPRDAVGEAEIVFSMVADDAASHDVWNGGS